MNPDPIDDDEPSIVVRPRRKGIYALPNAITLGALFSAFYAIVMAMNGRFEVACVAIFAAAILDSLDGRVARMTRTQTLPLPHVALAQSPPTLHFLPLAQGGFCVPPHPSSVGAGVWGGSTAPPELVRSITVWATERSSVNT